MGKHYIHHAHGLNGDIAFERGGDGTLRRGRDAGRARGRRSRQARAAIVAESCADGAVISDVARRHGISPQQLFSWRWAERIKIRTAQSAEAQAPGSERGPEFERETGPAFVRVAASASGLSFARAVPGAALPENGGTIEIALGGAVIRVQGAVDPAALCAVLKALQVAS